MTIIFSFGGSYENKAERKKVRMLLNPNFKKEGNGKFLENKTVDEINKSRGQGKGNEVAAVDEMSEW